MSNYTGSVPDTVARLLDWLEKAACRDEDPDLFSAEDREHEARTICVARCPVRAQCRAHVKESEHGLHRDQRDGVIAGLTHNERYRLDPRAPRRKDDTPLLTFDGTERCGTHTMLLRHLWLGEPIDDRCWSGQVFRDHDNRALRQRSSGQAGPESAAVSQPTAEPVVKKQPEPRGGTPKERHVYRLWARGLGDGDIARSADLSLPAVQRIRAALGLVANLPLGKAS